MKKFILTIAVVTGISCIACAETAIEQLGLTPEKAKTMQVPVPAASEAGKVTEKKAAIKKLMVYTPVTIQQTHRINGQRLGVVFTVPGIEGSAKVFVSAITSIIFDMNLLKENKDETVLFIDTEEGRIRGYVVPTPAPHDDILMWLPKSGAVTSAYLVQNALVGQPSTHPKYGTVVHIEGGKISAPAVVPSQLFTVVKKHADMSSSGKRTPVVIVGLRSVLDGVGEILGIYDNGVILIPVW